jgi:alkylhydroperoxidase/carboxymuconolactone decarboxylase family protein YurZ
VLRLGLNERGITEILGIAEHVASISATAEGLRLRSDVPDAPHGPATELVAPVQDSATEGASTTLQEVREWSRGALGVDHVPAFWRVLARRAGLLAAVWAKHRLVLGAGQLDAAAKLCVALAVAMNKQSSYWTSYFAQQGRHAGVLDDDTIVEIAGSVMHFVAYNTIAHGMMLEPPFRDLVAAELPADP